MTAADQMAAGVEPNGAMGADEAKLIAAAGEGDLAGLRNLSSAWFNRLYHSDPATPGAWFAAGTALILSRLAASHRHVEDMSRLAGVLCMCSGVFQNGGEHGYATACDAECMNLCEHLAEHGHEGGAIAGNELLGSRSPELLELVREYRTMTSREEETA